METELQPEPTFEDYEPAEEKGAFERFGEVFTSPKTAFSGLLSSNRKGSIIGWGFLISILLPVLSVFLAFSSPEKFEQIKQSQIEQMKQKHNDGKMTDEQYAAATKQIEGGTPTMWMLFGIIGSAVGVPIFITILAAIGYAVARFLERDRDIGMNFSAVLAAYLIAEMILNLEHIVVSILGFVTGKVASGLSLSMLLDTSNPVLGFLYGLADPFRLWWIVVFGIALAVLARVPTGKAIAVWAAVCIVGGIGFSELMSLLPFATMGK